MIGLIEDERGTSWFRLCGFDISDAGNRKLDSCYQEVLSKKENSSNLATGTRWRRVGGGMFLQSRGLLLLPLECTHLTSAITLW